MSWNPWEPEQYRYVAIQAAGDGEGAQQASRVSVNIPELLGDPRYVEHMWRGLDTMLLEKYDHVARNRLRLTLPTNHMGTVYWYRWERERDAEVWGMNPDDYLGVPTYLLDGPEAGRVLRTTSEFFPIRLPKNDGTELEYKILDFAPRRLRVGVLVASRQMMPAGLYEECDCRHCACSLWGPR